MDFKVIVIISMMLFAASIYSNDTLSDDGHDMLFVYEENNEQIDKWVELFKTEFNDLKRTVEFVTSADAHKKNVTSFSTVVIYGAVQAFTFKEPVREWLKSDVSLAGKKVFLLVTANRWFAADYLKQLKNELTKKNAETVNAVSAATAKMSDTDKTAFVKQFIQNIP
jgi:hypothetical protein